MAGGLASIGTGLTGFMEGFQKARQEAALNALRQLTIQQSQQQDQANSAAWAGLPALLGQGGGLPSSPMPGQASTPNAPTFPGGGDFDTPPPSYAPSPAAGVGTGLSLPTGRGGGFAAGIKALTDLGLSPEYAGAATSYMDMNESPQGAQSLNPSSGAYGRAQWLGPRKAALTSQYGPQPNDDQQAQFMKSELQGSERGTMDKLLAAQAAGKPPEEAYRIWGQSYERPAPKELQLAFSRIGSLTSASQGLMRQVHVAAGPEGTQEATQTANAAGQQLAQLGGQGRQSLANAAAAIEAANPNASPAVKFMALSQISKLLAPSDRTELSLLLLQQKQDFAKEMQEGRLAQQKEMFDLRQKQQEEMSKLRADQKNPDLVEMEGGGVGALKPDLTVTPIPGITGKVGAVGSRGSAPQNIQGFDSDGKVVFEGSAVYKSGTGWIDPKEQTPVPGVRWERTGQGAAGGAGRSGAQISRQLTSSREILSDLQNVRDMPLSSSRGIFGGRSQGPGLLDALKENLAETVTSEDAELTNSALAGLGRELSIVVSPVYGGKWAADSFNALSLKEGQTNLVKAYNLARMKQTADNALETIENTDWVGKQQKEYAKTMRSKLDEAIFWTPKQVMDFRRSADDRETFGDFVKKEGISAPPKAGDKSQTGAPAPSSTAPAPGSPAAPGMRPPPAKYLEGDVIVNPQTNEKLYYRNGKWEPL